MEAVTVAHRAIETFPARFRKDEEVLVVNVSRLTFRFLLENPENQVAVITKDGRRILVPARELAVA
jgi:hypothetical protein